MLWDFFVNINNLWFVHCWWGLTTLFNWNKLVRKENIVPSVQCVGRSIALWTVKSAKRKVGCWENLSIFLAGKSARMEESSSSEAIASVRETTPFVRDKQRTREMNYICAIGSRIMKMIDRYLFDIGKFTCHTLLVVHTWNKVINFCLQQVCNVEQRYLHTAIN